MNTVRVKTYGRANVGANVTMSGREGFPFCRAKHVTLRARNPEATIDPNDRILCTITCTFKPDVVEPDDPIIPTVRTFSARMMRAGFAEIDLDDTNGQYCIAPAGETDGYQVTLISPHDFCAEIVFSLLA